MHFVWFNCIFFTSRFVCGVFLTRNLCFSYNISLRVKKVEKFVIEGGKKLFGKVEISCAKNACLPLISASLLCENVFLHGVPKIADVCVMADIFKSLGGSCEFCGGGLKLRSKNVNKCEPDENKSKNIRASLFFTGALLARFKKAVVYKPGGCNIGSRPIDIHVSGLAALGAVCKEEKNKYIFNGENMRAGKVVLRYPSVGATINLIEAAVLLQGETVIKNAAKEPEILCLCNFLNSCGFKIYGGGTSEIIVDGVQKISCGSRVSFEPIKDRIEAGTFMCACAACGGEISLITEKSGVIQTVNFLRRAGGEISETLCESERDRRFGDGLGGGLCEFWVRFKNRPRCASVKADVFPSFATDMQPLAVAALLKSLGESVVSDDVYGGRFAYAEELKKFGAEIEILKGKARVFGVEKLRGASVTAGDLRGGAALVLAAVSANGKSEVSGAEKIRRGYENFDQKLRLIGADVKHVF